MQDSGLPELISPLAVVAHDAGTANQIFAWLRKCSDVDLRVCVSGPAESLWNKTSGGVNGTPLEQTLQGASMLLSGTSFAADFEHQARLAARKANIPSVGVIDHWVNYAERFTWNGRRILPDEIWVVDEYALAIAETCFPDVIVRRQANFYLSGILADVQFAERHSKRDGTGTHVLYVLEPIRHSWADGGEAGEFQALDYFIDNLERIGSRDSVEIRLRPHPSDFPGKYDAWLARNTSIHICLDPTPTLSESISWSDMVVGCETYALVVGLAAGRRVISTLPPHAPRCRLPMAGIFHLRDLSLGKRLGPAS